MLHRLSLYRCTRGIAFPKSQAARYRKQNFANQSHILSAQTPATAIEMPFDRAILHYIHKHQGGTTGRYLVKFKDSASKSAFLERVNDAKITITHKWDIGVSGAKALNVGCQLILTHHSFKKGTSMTNLSTPSDGLPMSNTSRKMLLCGSRVYSAYPHVFKASDAEVADNRIRNFYSRTGQDRLTRGGPY